MMRSRALAAVLPIGVRQLALSALTPPVIQEALGSGLLNISKAAGAGRGVFAAQRLRQGQVVLEEKPFLCAPRLGDQVCHHCLAVLQPNGGRTGEGNKQGRREAHGRALCSSECEEQALGSYLAVEAAMELGRLHAHCVQTGESFPILAARLAAMQLQQAARTVAGAGGDVAVAPAPLSDLALLCFANVPPPPPEPWREAHALLREGVDAFVGQLRGGRPERDAVQRVAAALDLEWYVQVQSRVHINSFRVDAILPFDWTGGLAAAAAAVVSSGGKEASSGTAVYLMASLFNHSCAPNLTVTYPYNDSTAVFTAAREVGPGEQLCITYIDENMPTAARRERLLFAYGFRCECCRCTEEAAGG